MQRELYDDNKQMKWLKKNLGIYIDEQNILRCKGRFENSLLTFNERNPILLPKNGHLLLMLIRKAHEKTEHGNIKDTLAELRTKYWIINSRKMVTNYVSKCILCKRLDGAPFKSQEASQLPSFRVSQSYPFANTGVDYAGPYLVFFKNWLALSSPNLLFTPILSISQKRSKLCMSEFSGDCASHDTFYMWAEVRLIEFTF